MGSGFDINDQATIQNYANQYLDDVHEWAKLNNSESIIQYIFDNALSPYTSFIIPRKEK